MTSPHEQAPARGTSPARLVRRTLLILAPLAALGAAWWFTRRAPAPAAAGEHDHSTMAMGGDSARSVSLSASDEHRIGVTFAEATYTPLDRQVRTVGQVSVDETRMHTVSLKVDGWVERLYVDYTGQSVASGTPLLSIYSPMLVTAQEELLLAKRLEQQVAGGSAQARSESDDLVAAARRRLAWWDVPQETIDHIEHSNEVQRTITLRAPAGGVVVEKLVTAGQRVMAGETLYRLADLSSVWVDGEVYEQDLRTLSVGQLATAEFDALPGERFAGRVSHVFPILTPETRTARIRLSLRNPGLRLKPGMYATLLLDEPARSPVLSVPRGAVLATGERQLVFVRRSNGQLEPRQVQTGATSDTRIEILRGLVAGDTVVASATFLVDAESNLGTALGGMGDMPGMEFTIPPSTAGSDSSRTPSRGAIDTVKGAPGRRKTAPMPDMPGMPGKSPVKPAPKAPDKKGHEHDGHAGHDSGGR
ncbi:MAG: efflux RND transporter periplasmic adaptor subunit [Gemmatimonadetes bacterium]|nr:efflux RND transporter periplasmic adaptor subunit [Gemmatimonadota bacterium]